MHGFKTHPIHAAHKQKKEVPKKAYEDKGRVAHDEGPLDDPVAEKLRQQK